MRVLAVLGDRHFAWYTLANGSAFVAAWMHRLAIGWIIWQLTHSGFWLGLLAICDLGPALVFGPLGGVLSDRGSAERVIAWSQLLVVLVTLATGAAAWFGASAELLLALALAGGAAVATEDAGRATIVTAIAPDELAGPAVALTAVVINLARFVGPALAGILAVLTDVVAVFPVAALMGLPLALFAARAGNSVEPRSHSTHWLGDLRDALLYVGRHPMIALVLLNFLLSSLFARSVYELVPGLANGLFGRDIAGLSAMTTALGLGAVAAGMVLMRSRSSAAGATASFAGALSGGLIVIVLALMPNFAGALAAAALLGFSISLAAIAAQIVVQIESRDTMRNRALSLWAMIIRAAPALGAIGIGALADLNGFRWPLGLAGAAATICATACWAAFRRQSARPA